MKTRLIAFFLFAASLTLRAQVTISIYTPDEAYRSEVIDQALFIAQYQVTSVADTLHPDNRIEETMWLKVGATRSVFYSYARALIDSILEQDRAAHAPREVIEQHMRQYSSSVAYQVYKNYPSGKVTFLDAVGASRFRTEETNDRPEWTLLPDTATLIGYPCRKAVCYFKGRHYEAWYTPAISRSEGPWKLYGLPGLILKARDSQGYFTFTCTAIRQCHNPEPIRYPGDSYEPISRKALQKVYARYAADPLGYLAQTAPQMHVTLTGSDGKPMRPKNTPFNPIEKTEK